MNLNRLDYITLRTAYAHMEDWGRTIINEIGLVVAVGVFKETDSKYYGEDKATEQEIEQSVYRLSRYDLLTHVPRVGTYGVRYRWTDKGYDLFNQKWPDRKRFPFYISDPRSESYNLKRIPLMDRY
jgi:hypothetical protein